MSLKVRKCQLAGENALWYRAYAKKHGLKLDDLYYRAETALGKDAFDRPQSNMGKLGGLYDRNGDAININTASPELVEQGIRGTADEDERKARAKAFYSLCRTKGSRFYGYVPGDDIETFRDSATLTQSEYNKLGKEYLQLFRQGDDSRAYNETAYAAKRQFLETTDTLDSLSRKTLLDLLDKSYRGVTGMEPPEYTPETETQETDSPDQEPEEKWSWGKLFDGVKGDLPSVNDIVDAVTSPTLPPATDADTQEEAQESEEAAQDEEEEEQEGEAPDATDSMPSAPGYLSVYMWKRVS